MTSYLRMPLMGNMTSSTKNLKYTEKDRTTRIETFVKFGDVNL